MKFPVLVMCFFKVSGKSYINKQKITFTFNLVLLKCDLAFE